MSTPQLDYNFLLGMHNEPFLLNSHFIRPLAQTLFRLPITPNMEFHPLSNPAGQWGMIPTDSLHLVHCHSTPKRSPHASDTLASF